MVASVLFVTRPSPGLGALSTPRSVDSFSVISVSRNLLNLHYSTESMKPRNLKCKENVSSKKYLKAMFHHDTHPPICSFSSRAISAGIVVRADLDLECCM
mmetsp:Transcript_41782/g.131739  ORF Transcript_41782/g.131739 Transcript_41782/m.131739 type:complete len:100 (+) Transcript_41782:1708-2007(+)